MYAAFPDRELEVRTLDLYAIVVDSLKLLIEMLLRCRKEDSRKFCPVRSKLSTAQLQ
jgi:hypothetical protein